MIDGTDIIKALIELLEIQENIKVQYDLGGEDNS